MQDRVKTLNGENTSELVSYEYGVFIDNLSQSVVQTPNRKSAEAFIAAINQAQWGIPPAAKYHAMLVSRKVVTTRDLWVEL